MAFSKFDSENQNIAWCPGCGNWAILTTIKKALEEVGFENKDTVLVSGIGQAAKTPQYVKTNFFNGLHGRAIPAATGIKAANKYLNVVVTSGDGDIYGEGGNHFLHAIRRNPSITVFVFNNMVYGLTKGQASPTSAQNFITKTQPKGVASEAFNPLAIAIAQNISFAARAFCKDIDKTKEIMKEALTHNGFALVDVLTPCVTFNKINDYKWFQENSYYLENHDSSNRLLALEREINTNKLPLGVIFKQDKVTFEQGAANAHKTEVPLHQRFNDFGVDFEKLKSLL